MSYHAPRPVRLDLAFVTTHEKVPEAKKGNDGVLLLRPRTLMKYIVPSRAPRPVHLSFVYVTAHEKVPETKKGDDGVLLLRLGALMMYTVPYRAPLTNCALASVAKSGSNHAASILQTSSHKAIWQYAHWYR